MPDQLRAQRASPAQAGILGRIHALSWQGAYRGLLPEHVLTGITAQMRAALFIEAMRDKPVEFYLYLHEGEPLGMAALHLPPGLTDGEVGSFYFLPEAWGKGHASPAMAHCLDRLRELRYRRAIVWVFEKNLRARRFYEKCGFQVTGERKELRIGVPVTEVQYALVLAK